MRPGRANPLAALGLLLAAGGFFGGPGRRAPPPIDPTLTPEQAEARKRWLAVRHTARRSGLKPRRTSVAQCRRDARKARNRAAA